jgi:hypothetical protein
MGLGAWAHKAVIWPLTAFLENFSVDLEKIGNRIACFWEYNLERLRGSLYGKREKDRPRQA